MDGDNSGVDRCSAQTHASVVVSSAKNNFMILRELDPVVLVGHHVRLEPIEERHRDGLGAIAGDARIWTYLAVDGSTPDVFNAMLDEALAERANGVSLPFVVRRLADGVIVGSTRYMNISRVHGQLEVGWTWYTPAVWAGVVNPDCKLALLTHAFERLGAVRVALRCDARNQRSHDAILRLGAVKEGVLRRHRLVQHGFIRDTAQFSIIDSEWPQVKAGLERRLEQAADGGAVPGGSDATLS